MTTRQSTRYRALLISAVLALFALGSLYGGVAAAVEGDVDRDGDVDLHDLMRLGQLWMAEPGPMGQLNSLSPGSRSYSDDLGQMSENLLFAADGNEPVVTDVILTPEGGYFELPGGLVIDVPPGAVSEGTSFQIRLLEAEEAEPYLDIGATEKGFMGGFEVISDGIVFDVPIWIRFPVEPLHDANSLPHIFYLNKDNGTLIPDLPEAAAAPVQAAYSILAAATAEGGVMYDPRDAIAEFMISITPPERQSQMLVELYDVLGHSDCVANPCRCLRQFVTSRAADLIESDRCSKVSENGSIQFPDCPGEPIETWNMEEQSIQIAYTMNPNRRNILCEGALTLTVDVFGIDGERREGHEVEVTSSRPDLLEVTSFIGNVFLLERVGDDTGVAQVVIDAGCEVTRTVPIQVGCKIPSVTGRWSVSGSESWWGCQDPEDNGTYPHPPSMSITFDSQVESPDGVTFAGSLSFEEHDLDVIMYYTESYRGEITPDCEITDRCVFKVSGSTTYTEKYVFPDDEGGEPYYIRGRDTFSGTLKGNVMTLSTSGGDTSGDTCKSEGSVVLRR